MTPQERQLVDDLFDRLARVENAPREPDATAAIEQGQRRAPNAIYALVQTVLLQDEALRRAHERIQALEGGAEPPAQQGGFLDSMRGAIFGGDRRDPPQPPSRGSVPPSGRPVWNSGQAMGQPQGGPQGGFGQPQMAQDQSGQPPGQQPRPAMGGGGSFLGTAAAAAAGVVGGSLLMSSMRSMMGGGGEKQAFGGSGDGGGGPWGGSGSGAGTNDLANQAGLGDIGSRGGDSGSRGGDNARQGFTDQASGADANAGNDRGGWFDQASNEDDQGMGDFDDGGDSDYA